MNESTVTPLTTIALPAHTARPMTSSADASAVETLDISDVTRQPTLVDETVHSSPNMSAAIALTLLGQDYVQDEVFMASRHNDRPPHTQTGSDALHTTHTHSDALCSESVGTAEIAYMATHSRPTAQDHTHTHSLRVAEGHLGPAFVPHTSSYASSLPPEACVDPLRYQYATARPQRRPREMPRLSPHWAYQSQPRHSDVDDNLTSVSQQRRHWTSKVSRFSRHTASSRRSITIQPIDVNTLLETQARMQTQMMALMAEQQTTYQRQVLQTITEQREQQNKTLLNKPTNNNTLCLIH